MRIISEANVNDHWSKKNKRKKEIKKIIGCFLNPLEPPKLPCKVILTRIAPRALDIDNLYSALKVPIDAVCDWIIPGLAPGLADSDKRIEIVCDQKKGLPKYYALEVAFCPQEALERE